MDPLRDGPESSWVRGGCPQARIDLEGGVDRYRWLVENSVDVIAEIDVDGIIRFASPAIERVLGYRPEEVMGTSYFALIHADDMPKTREAFAYILQNPGVSGPQLELRARHKDGSWRYIEAQGKNVTRESIQSATVLCLRDVTAHKQAEAARADRTRQLETVRMVSEEIARELDLPRVLELITRRAVELVGASSGILRSWDDEHQLLVAAAWTGVPSQVPTVSLRLGEGISGEAARRREGLYVNEFRISPYAIPALLDGSVHTAVMAVPLLYRERLVGVLAITRNATDPPFTDAELQILNFFTPQTALAIENARLFQQEQVRCKELEAVRSVSEEITREMDLTVLLRLILERAVELAAGDTGVLYLWSEDTQRLIPSNWHGYDAWVADVRLRLEEGVSGTVAARRQGLIVNDFRSSPYATPLWLDRSRQVAALSEPLLYHDRLVGVITTSREDPHRPFTTEDQRLLRLFAAQAAIAIENAQLHAAAVRRSHELEAILKANQAIESSLDLDTRLREIVRQAAAITGAAVARILLVEDDGQVLRSRVGIGPNGSPEESFSLLVGESFSGQVALTGKPLVVPDTRNDPRLRFPDHVEQRGLVSYLGLPVKSQGQLLGVLVLNSTAPRTYPQSEIDVLTLFADQAALAIASARLFESTRQALADKTEAEETLRERSRELEAVRTISAEIIRELDLPGVLNLIVRHAVALGSATSGSIRLWNPERQLLVPEAATGSLRHAAGISLGLGEGVVGTAAAQRRGLIVNDFRTSAYAIPPLLEGTIHTAVMATPLLYGERLVGVLGITREQTEPAFTERDLEVLNLFAPQAAIAIENARLHEASVHRGAQLEALLFSLRTVTSGLDLREILDRILGEAVRISGAPHVKVLLRDKAADTLRVGALRGSSMPAAYTLPVGVGSSGLVAQSGEPLFMEDAQNDPRSVFADQDRELGIVTYLGLPIKKGEEVLGVLTFNTISPHQYTPEEMTLLSSFADQAAIAIENAQLFDAAQRDLRERQAAEEALARRTRQLEAVKAVGEEIARELDVDALLDLLASRAATLVSADVGTIFLWDEAAQLLRPRGWVGPAQPADDRPRRLGEGVTGAAAQLRTGLLVNDFPQSPYALDYILAQAAVSAVLAQPFFSRGSLIGVFSFSKRGDPAAAFTPEDQAVLSLLAPQAAIAIENARLYAELNQSYQSLQRAQAELVRSEKLRGLGQMAAGIAHDLNNMLAAILGQVELLKLRGAPPDVRDGLARLETAASDGAQVVRRLQDFARQRAVSPLAPMDLAQAVQEALELTRPRWQDELQQRGKTIAIHAALGDLPPILGHAPEIREVLTNLIFNAVDAMPDGGRLTLAGAATPTGITLALRDTGVGMTEDVRRKIFEPFFTTKGVKGTGLGLAVVYSILERHGGRVAVASAPGQGTTVTLHFQAAAAGIAAPAAALPLRPAPRRLLLIDDETTVRTTMGTLLRAVGHEVTEAENGPDGLASLAGRPVDLVITDLGMPDMTGWEVARQIKATHPRLPVILLTGWGQQAPPPASGQECVDRVLDKPIRLEALQEVIAALTGPGESPPRTT
jgi:PAS domain S-box-containing protein